MDGQAALVAIDPRDGRVLADLHDEPSDGLADLVLELKGREADLHAWRRLLEDELRDRLAAGNRTIAVVGNYEIAYRPSRESVWDPDDTEAALRALVDEGWITASEATGIIETKREVRRSNAKRLLGRLSGPARDTLNGCMTWRDRGHPALTVVPVVQLEPPAERTP